MLIFYKSIQALSLILALIILCGCPEKADIAVNPTDPTVKPPVKVDTIRVLQISWVNEVFTFGPRSFSNSVDRIEYFNFNYLPSSDKSNQFRLPVTLDEYCDSPEFDCGNRQNVRVQFENFDVEQKTLPNDKYLVSSGAAFYPTKGSKIIISTIDGKSLFDAKTGSKIYSVNKIEFIIKVPLDFNQLWDVAAYMEPVQGNSVSNIFSPTVTAFSKYWGDPSIELPQEYGTFNVDFLDKYKGGTMQLFSSRRTKTELLALLNKSAEKKFSVIRRWTRGPVTPTNNFFHEFSVISVLDNEKSERFEIIK